MGHKVKVIGGRKGLEKPSEEGDMVQMFCGVFAEHLSRRKRKEVVGLLRPRRTVSTTHNKYIYLLHHLLGGVCGGKNPQRFIKGNSARIQISFREL